MKRTSKLWVHIFFTYIKGKFKTFYIIFLAVHVYPFPAKARTIGLAQFSSIFPHVKQRVLKSDPESK